MLYCNIANIQSMIMIACGSYKTEYEQRAAESIENLDDWDDANLAPYLKVYTREDFQELWSEHVKFYRKFTAVCKDRVNLIACPVFFVAGGKDPLCPPEHGKFYAETIRNIKIHIFPDGAHNVHHVYLNEFNAMAQEFFLNN